MRNVLSSELAAVRAEMKAGFDGLNRTLLQGLVAMTIAVIAGSAGIVAALVTQV